MTDPVTVAYVHGHEVAYSWHKSYLDLMVHDLTADRRTARGGTLAVKYPTGGIVDARNQVVEQFLQRDVPWLWWVDTDMGFPPDIVDRLAQAAVTNDATVIGALCFAHRETEPDGFGGWHTTPVPTLYDWVERPDGLTGFAPRYTYQRDTVQQVAATGSAAILIHRDVFTAIDGGWYDPVVNPSDGRRLGEDMSFCVRATAAGHPVHVDTSVKTTHFKNLWVGEHTFERAASGDH